MLNIIADDAIPLLDMLPEPPSARLIRLPTAQITAATIANADALLVRSVTKVDSALLENTRIQFVGTATSGIDHLDTRALAQQGITWASSSGANAQAVSEYVIACLALLQTQGHLPKRPLKCGVIGAGKIGCKVIHFLHSIGATVLVNDPPRSRTERDFVSTPLANLSDCDLLTVHVPLVQKGIDSSFHLINSALLNQQKKCVLINTSRGEVVDSAALGNASHIIACLDVWENEPAIDVRLLKKAMIATPHIAGYSAAAKCSASVMIMQKMLDFFNLESSIDDEAIRKQYSQQHDITLSHPTPWQEQVLQIYNPANDTRNLKQNTADIAKHFLTLRRQYRFRDSLAFIPKT